MFSAYDQCRSLLMMCGFINNIFVSCIIFQNGSSNLKRKHFLLILESIIFSFHLSFSTNEHYHEDPMFITVEKMEVKSEKRAAVNCVTSVYSSYLNFSWNANENCNEDRGEGEMPRSGGQLDKMGLGLQKTRLHSFVRKRGPEDGRFSSACQAGCGWQPPETGRGRISGVCQGVVCRLEACVGR